MFEKNTTEIQRKHVAEFTFAALQGDYEAVFLDEIKRGIEGDQLSYEFISELIPSCRYGKATERSLLRMREVFADQEDILQDNKFVEAWMIHGYHYHSESDPARKTVESDNIRTMFELAKRMGNRAVVHLRSQHIPAAKSSALELVSGNNFRVF